MDRTRLLEKIQKCFNLSKSSNPGEAANALRQAQKLMDLHGVSQRELGAVGYGKERVSLPVQANIKFPAYLAYLNQLICKAFGVSIVICREIRVSDYSYCIDLFGPQHRVILAKYAYEVVFREMNKSWTGELKEHPEYKGLKGARSGFLISWIETVHETITDFAISDEEKERTENEIGAAYPTLSKSKTNKVRVYNETVNSGRDSAANFRLHRPVTEEHLKIGK